MLANKNAYERKGIEQSLRVSFHDLHESEKSQSWKQDLRRPHRHGKRSYHVHDLEEDEPRSTMMKMSGRQKRP